MQNLDRKGQGVAQSTREDQKTHKFESMTSRRGLNSPLICQNQSLRSGCGAERVR